VKKEAQMREIAKQISFFTIGLADFAATPGIGIGFTPKSIGNPFRKLKKILKQKIQPYNLKVVKKPELANYMVILYSEFDNEDGYDCFGCQCYPKSKTKQFPNVEAIRYSGVEGDVNTLRFNSKNSKVIFLSPVETKKAR